MCFLSQANAGNVATAQAQATVISQNTELVLNKFDTEKISMELVGEVGTSDCPMKYHLKIKQKNMVKQTPIFGTCSDIVRAKIINNKLIVSMPDHKGGAISYQYDINLLSTDSLSYEKPL
jgi:hypothetical protein